VAARTGDLSFHAPPEQGTSPFTRRVESGLLLKEACSRYVFGYFDGVPQRRPGGYYLPLDVGHSWKSVKYALQRREAMAIEQGLASCFHVRGILYGESLPTQARSRGGQSKQAGTGRGRGRGRGRAGQHRGADPADANVAGGGAGAGQDVGASSHAIPMSGGAPSYAAAVMGMSMTDALRQVDGMLAEHWARSRGGVL
jgi:hypothetical protein